MRYLLIFMILGSSLLANASSMGELSAKQKKSILKNISKTCADTWCEGAHVFSFDSFNKLKVSSGYVLSFRLKEFGKEKWVSATCEFETRTTYTSYISKKQLNDDFYRDLTECINNAQSDASGIMIKTDLYGNIAF